MNDFSLSQLLTSSSSSYSNGNQTFQVLNFQPSSTNKSAIEVWRSGPYGDFLLFFFTLSSTKPNVQLHRLGVGNTQLQPTLIGNAVYHSVSSKVDLILNDQSIVMKSDFLTGDYKLDYFPIGKLKWKEGSLSGYKLLDGAGNLIANFKSGLQGIKGGVLELLVPSDEHFLDLIVLSVIVVIEMQTQNIKGASEVVQAIAGA